MTYRTGTIGEFRAWTKRVIRDPKSARGQPKRWFDSRRTANAALRREISAEALVKLLSPQNVRLLTVLAKRRPDSVRQLAELTGRKETSVSRTVKKLAQAGIIGVSRGHDRRLRLELIASRVHLEIDLTGAERSGVALRAKAAG